MSAGVTAESLAQTVEQTSDVGRVRPILALSVVGIGLALNLVWLGSLLWIPAHFFFD
jgi:hypothetical protein